MKNLLFAVIGLIVVIVAVFLFTSKRNPSGDTIIPSPQLAVTPTSNLSNIDLNATNKSSEKMKVPFEVLGAEQINGKKVIISTDKGDITLQLFADAPTASSNFLYLVNKKFYDGLIFHRVIKDFMIQGGDPQGNGGGGPGYTFLEDKIVNNGKYNRGIVAMAKRSDEPPGTGGSQFFIMHKDSPLPPEYAIFGQVISGMDVVDAIANSQVEGDKPLQPIVMKKVTVE